MLADAQSADKARRPLEVRMLAARYRRRRRRLGPAGPPRCPWPARYRSCCHRPRRCGAGMVIVTVPMAGLEGVSSGADIGAHPASRSGCLADLEPSHATFDIGFGIAEVYALGHHRQLAEEVDALLRGLTLAVVLSVPLEGAVLPLLVLPLELTTLLQTATGAAAAA